MGMKRWLVLFIAAFALYHVWSTHHLAREMDGYEMQTGANGFVHLPAAPQGHSAGDVYVVAAENCPEEAARRADGLYEQLVQAGVSVRRTHRVEFEFEQPLPRTAQRKLDQIMNDALPLVFIGNRVQPNPGFEAVMAELSQSLQPSQ